LGIAPRQGLGFGAQVALEIGRDPRVDGDALDRDADLPGEGEGPLHEFLRRPGEVRRSVDPRGSRTAELEVRGTPFELTGKVPTHARRAREGKLREPLVAHEATRDLVVGVQHGEHPRRQVAAMAEIRDGQADERGLRRGFEHDGATRRDRRDDLVEGQVQRKVKGGDREQWTPRLAHDVGQGPLRPAQRRRVRVEAFGLEEGRRLADRPIHRGGRPRDLGAGERERLADFVDEQERQAVGLGFETELEARQEGQAFLEREEAPEDLGLGFGGPLQSGFHDLEVRTLPGGQETQLLEGRIGGKRPRSPHLTTLGGVDIVAVHVDSVAAHGG